MTLPPASSCAVCGKATAKQCSRCKLVRYCCKACQRSDWKSGHKSRCRDFLSSVKGKSKQSVPILQRKKSSAISPVPFSGKTNILNQSKKVLFPYEEFLDFFHWDGRGFIPCGLKNCGNSCFANVVLQCLTHTKPLVAYLLAKDHLSTCRSNHWCFLCEFQHHVEQSLKSRDPFSPTDILSRLPSIDANLSCGKQEDAHEFMRSAINRMQMVFLDEFGGEKAVSPSSRETTLIQHIFGGRLQSQVTCSKCNNLSIRFENMMDLTVEIHGEFLEKCLHKFTAEECMDGEDMYKCDRCNDYVKARKRLMIHKAPNILTIALKRFQRGRLEKLDQMVTFPENLALYSYMTEERDENDMFKLYAVIVHVNRSKASNFGHYICYIKNFGGSWYRINDDKVIEVSIDEVLSQKAYVLFYSRIVARPTSLYPIESVNEEENDLVEAEGKQHSPLQPLECHKTTVSPAICTDSGSLPTEHSSEVKVVGAKKELSSVANYEDGKEDSIIVESGESSKGLPELQDVGVSSAAEATSRLRTVSSPCSSSAEAVVDEILDGRFFLSDIEEETERCEGTAYEDQNMVESKASRHDLPELQDVGVSGEAERPYCLSLTLAPCPFIDSSAEALVRKPEGSFLVSNIEEETKRCEGTAYEDQNMVESKASLHDLPELQDVGVSGEAERPSCLSITLPHCPFIDSSAEALVRKPEGSFLVSNIEEETERCEGTAYEDQNMVESKASRHDLPELQDVRVSGEAERPDCLSITLAPCPFIDSSAEALVQKPEGSFHVSDIEGKTKTCEENKESLLESCSDDSIASTDAQYDGSASPSSSPEISSDMEFDNSTLLPKKADVLKTDGGSSSGKKLKPLLTPGFLVKRPRTQRPTRQSL